MSDTLTEHDRYYLENGPSCAGCDHWRPYADHQRSIGECQRHAPGQKEHLPPGISWCSRPDLYSEYPITKHSHKCGDFADTFDWNSIPGAGLLYRLMRARAPQ